MRKLIFADYDLPTPMTRLFIALLVLKFGFTAAQPASRYSSLPFVDTIPASVYQSLQNKNEADKARIQAPGKIGDFMKALYDQRFEYVVRSFNHDYFMINDRLTAFVQKVHDNIYDANPELARETTVYTYRSASPNAMTFGDGTVCVMLGLIARIETEDALAFVLCHELAHHHARHAAKRIERIANLNYDRTLKKQIGEIQTSRYNKYSKLKALFNSLDFSINRHSREEEQEADSIALTYFLKTNYNKFAPLHCMQILNSVDTSLYRANIDFRKFFDFKEFPFKDSWDTYKRSDLWNDMPQPVPDTSRTHPETEKRFAALQRQLGIYNFPPDQMQTGKTIAELSQFAGSEIINTQYHFKQYGKALFNALIAAESSPENVYAHAMIVKCLYQLYRAQKAHALSKSLELPGPHFDENYNRFLSFIHKLRLYELASLAYQYALTRPESFYTDEEFIHALWMVSHFEFSKISPEKVRDDYALLFPRGKYLKDLSTH